jgi:benzoyl-CoA reductase/2-hydroxyglutaryl-CoA dehydratase subunit BcrC/BadD/HgdB
MQAHLDGESRYLGYACSYVPLEIIMAAGMEPFRILPQPAPSEADTYIHPQTCFFAKSLLASLLKGVYSQINGIVLANSCDAMSRLADLIQQYSPDVPVVFLDVPKKKDADSVKYFTTELMRFAKRLTAQYQISGITEENLNKEIKACNQVRRLMEKVFALQTGGSRVKGSDIFKLYIEGTRQDISHFTEGINDFLTKIQPIGPSDAKSRVVFTGNGICNASLIEHIENAGVAVTVVDTCLGERHYGTLVEEDTADPYEALAKRYLMKPPCARMEGIGQRIIQFKEKVASTTADGVICVVPKYCDFLLYEIPLLKDNAGVPFLVCENDYSMDNEQINARVDAFLEMLERGGENA